MAEILKILTDREAAGLQPSGHGWPVKHLCKVYDVDQHLAAERLNKFITARRIAGPLLMR